MDNNPVYVTFEFNGNLGEEVEKVTLGIKGMRDESATTYKHLSQDSDEAFTSMNQNARRLAIEIEKDTRALQQVHNAQEALDAQLEAGAVTSEKYVQAKARLSILEENIRTEINQNIQALAEENNARNLAEGSINQLRQELIKLIETYNNLSRSQRESESGTALISQMRNVETQIKTASTAMNKGGVTAAGGYNALGMSVQQVARELPSLTMGANMFFLAISNNLPILADNLRAARIEYAALKAEGQAATPVWKQVVSSIFSW